MPIMRMMNRPSSRVVTLVAPRYLDEFLARRRLDYRTLKDVSNEKIEDSHSRLPGRIASWDRLHRDQKICVLIGARQPRFAFWNDPGTGKTMLALTLAKYHADQGSVRRVLVLAPNNSNLVEWEREIGKHYPQMKYAILSGSSEEKWTKLRANPEALITVATYPGLSRMVGKPVQVARKGRLKKELAPDPVLLRELRATFQGLVLDESSEVKGYDTLIFSISQEISQQARLVLCLSGTPFGRDPHGLWTQMKLVDGGETLGQTLKIFRGLFFKTTINPRGGYYEHNFIAAKKDLLNDLLANRSIRFKAHEADLPSVVMIPQHIELSQEAKDWYGRARSALRAARGEFARTKATFMQMRQLSSGFVGLPEDEDGERAKIEFEENPKLEQLVSIVESIPREYPVIIVHEFIYSGERIEKELKAKGIEFVSVRGGTKDPAEALRKFKAGEVTRLVINHKAGGFGLNLQNAGYMIFYESPVSSIMRRQVEARIVRNYSAWERVFIYDLMAADTVDERIREFHAEGADLFKAVLEGRIEL